MTKALSLCKDSPAKLANQPMYQHQEGGKYPQIERQLRQNDKFPHAEEILQVLRALLDPPIGLSQCHEVHINYNVNLASQTNTITRSMVKFKLAK
jgi:hypothetical protein